MLTQYPVIAQAAGVLASLIAVLPVLVGLWFFIRKVLNVLGVVFYRSIGFFVGRALQPLCALLVYHPIRRRMAMYAYLYWLESFEEEWVKPPAHRSRSWRLVGIFGRFGRKARRKVTHNIRLALRGRGNTTTELQGPGDIFLE